MFKKLKKKEKKRELNADVIEKLLSGDESLDKLSFEDIKKYKRNIFISLVLYFFQVVGFLALANPHYSFMIVFLQYIVMKQFAKYRNVKDLEQDYIEYLEEKKGKDANLEFTKENVDELIKVFSARPYGINNTLRNQGYNKVVASRPSLCLNTNNEALNPNFWNSNKEEQGYALVRRVG